jgi:hypothetical protein
MPNESDTHFDVRCVAHHLRRSAFSRTDLSKRMKGLKDVSSMAEPSTTPFVTHYESRSVDSEVEDDA